MFVLVKDGAVDRYPYFLSDLKKAHPNVSFPAVPSDEQLAVFNVFRIHGNPEPAYDHATQVLEYPAPVFDGSQWVQTSVVRNKTAEELAAAAAALQASIVQATQQRLDDFAKTRNYDGILSAATYASSTNTTFQAEGQRAVQLRDDTWQALYNILGQVATQGRVVTKFEDIEGDLPVLSWT